MNDFLEYIDELRTFFPVHLEVYYSKHMDWCITVWKKGGAEDYPNSPKSSDGDAVLCDIDQETDMKLAFAKAHVAVKAWMMVHEGGY